MRLLLVPLLALAAAVPATAAPPSVNNGIVYTVSAVSDSRNLAATCTVYADRLKADYGSTTVYAVASAPAGISTTVTCTVTKDTVEWVKATRTESSGLVVIDGEGHGTIPVAGLLVCVDADSQLSVDAHPTAHNCLHA